MTNFNQFSENSCKNANNFQTSHKTPLTLHNGDELKDKENINFPESFTQFQPQSQVKTVGIEPLNQFGVQQIPCSKTIIESVPIASSISTIQLQKPEQQFSHSHQISSVLHPISNEMFKNTTFEINSLPWTLNTDPYWQNATSKHSIELPPLKIQIFNGNPLTYHELINNIFASYITTPVFLTHIVSATCEMQLPVIQKMSSNHIRVILLMIAPL